MVLTDKNKKVAVFVWSGGGWKRHDIRWASLKEIRAVNKTRGFASYKIIPKNSIRFPPEPKWKPQLKYRKQ